MSEPTMSPLRSRASGRPESCCYEADGGCRKCCDVTIPHPEPQDKTLTAPSCGCCALSHATTQCTAAREECRRLLGDGWGGPSEGGDDLTHQTSGLARRPADLDAGGLEGLLLGLGCARRARDDGAGVAHRLALRRGEPGDVADDRLRHVLGDEGRGALLGVPADL